ncbi:MAG: superoxide dismutase, Ni [Planctomycetota bacterium]|jgi:nickel superoxide dismutase
MRYAIFPTLATLLLCLALQGPTLAHCEVPCGIYGDQQRFLAMLEDHKTVLKAMTQIQALAGKADAQSHNQLARWVANKESHATKIQHTIAQYFMAQRIKARDPKYVDKLTKAHAIIVAAMKCKQNVDTSHADALRTAILAFYEVYEGRKPDFTEHK